MYLCNVLMLVVTTLVTKPSDGEGHNYNETAFK